MRATTTALETLGPGRIPGRNEHGPGSHSPATLSGSNRATGRLQLRKAIAGTRVARGGCRGPRRRRGSSRDGHGSGAAAAIRILVFGSFVLGGLRVIELFGIGLASPDEGRQWSAPAGNTKRKGAREAVASPPVTREPWSPPLRLADTVVSGAPSCAVIQFMTAGKSAPAARIAARSMTTPPEECGRDNLVTSAVISRSSIASHRTRCPVRRRSRAKSAARHDGRIMVKSSLRSESLALLASRATFSARRAERRSAMATATMKPRTTPGSAGALSVGPRPATVTAGCTSSRVTRGSTIR